MKRVKHFTEHINAAFFHCDILGTHAFMFPWLVRETLLDIVMAPQLYYLLSYCHGRLYGGQSQQTHHRLFINEYCFLFFKELVLTRPGTAVRFMHPPGVSTSLTLYAFKYCTKPHIILSSIVQNLTVF